MGLVIQLARLTKSAVIG